jgi:hypothetical protein
MCCQMTREAFTAARKHKLMGMMLDCFMNGHRKGAEASLYLSTIQSQVMEELNRMYDDLQPKPAASPAKPQETANGKPGTAPARVP